MNDTLKQKCLAYLVSNGMFDNDAEKVFELFIQQDSQESMKSRWNEDAANYPPSILNLSLMSLKRFALEWINENQPLAWYKAMFEG